MHFSLDKTDNYLIIETLTERLDSSISPSFKSELVVLTAEGVKNIIIDMKNTKYCDSSGLSAILVANRLCKNAGGVFVLCNISDAVKKLISISQLDSILNIVSDKEEALEFLKSSQK